MMLPVERLAATVAVALSLAGCGGGEGNRASVGRATPAPPPTAATPPAPSPRPERCEVRSMHDSGWATTGYRFDDAGRPTEVWDNDGVSVLTWTTTYTYDDHGWPVRAEISWEAEMGAFPEPNHWRATFRAEGRTLTEERTYRNESTERITWLFDDSGRLSRRTSQGRFQTTPDEELEYGEAPVWEERTSRHECRWDDSGRVTAIVRGDAETRFEYDAPGRLPARVVEGDRVLEVGRDDDGHPELRRVDEDEGIDEHVVWVGDCTDVFFEDCAPRMVPAPPAGERPVLPRMD